jgi:hypothetical protein
MMQWWADHLDQLRTSSKQANENNGITQSNFELKAA